MLSFSDKSSVFVEHSNAMGTFVLLLSMQITGKWGKYQTSGGYGSPGSTLCNYPFSTYLTIICEYFVPRAQSSLNLFSLLQNCNSAVC